MMFYIYYNIRKRMKIIIGFFIFRYLLESLVPKLRHGALAQFHGIDGIYG